MSSLWLTSTISELMTAVVQSSFVPLHLSLGSQVSSRLPLFTSISNGKVNGVHWAGLSSHCMICLCLCTPHLSSMKSLTIPLAHNHQWVGDHPFLSLVSYCSLVIFEKRCDWIVIAPATGAEDLGFKTGWARDFPQKSSRCSPNREWDITLFRARGGKGDNEEE